jgi:asparagine synthase (glutamine-hydrolysing)
VLLIGDGSDEATGGYMYFHNAPSPQALHQENVRLLQDIIWYDALRADRGIASQGLEARVPFLDEKFIQTYLAIDPILRMPTQEVKGERKIEKWLLRKSFDCSNFLPPQVLWRMKEAFSDGVSSKECSWYEVIQSRVEGMYVPNDFEDPLVRFHIVPQFKEALHYRLMFNQLFHPRAANVIPYYWLPRWSGNQVDPSARKLLCYDSRPG